MKKVLILPNALIGYCCFENLPNNIGANCHEIKEEPILVFGSDESEKNHLIAHSFFNLCSKRAKDLLMKSGLTGVHFKRFKKTIREYLCNENGYLNGYEQFYDESWWLMCINSPMNNTDFIQWKTNLIVSENALKFLTENEIFADQVEGKVYGKEYEILTNRFLVEGEIEDFVLNKMPKHRKHIDNMRRKIMVEYRRREGLPPLNM